MATHKLLLLPGDGIGQILGPYRDRRHYRRAGQPVLCPQCRGGDAGAGRDRNGVSAKARATVKVRLSFLFRLRSR